MFESLLEPVSTIACVGAELEGLRLLHVPLHLLQYLLIELGLLRLPQLLVQYVHMLEGMRLASDLYLGRIRIGHVTWKLSILVGDRECSC